MSSINLLVISAFFFSFAAALPIPAQFANESNILIGRIQRRTCAQLSAETQRLRKESGLLPTSYLDTFLWSFDAGTPFVSYDVSTETGTQQSFVLSSSFKNKRRGGHYYNPRASSTSKKLSQPFRDSKWPLTVEGDTYQDKIRWEQGHIQKFGVVKTINGFGDEIFPTDGVMGLAWPVNGKRPAAGPDGFAVANLMGKSKEWKYQIWIRGDSAIISFGSDKMSHKAPAYFPLIMNTDRPYIRAEAFDMGDFHVKNDFRVSFDTGYGALLLPKDVYRSVLKLSKAEFDEATGVFVLPCNANLPEMVWTFSGLKYNMRKEFLLAKADHPTRKCVFPIDKDPNKEPTFTLGVPFFREYLIGFDLDNSKASLAPYYR